MSVEYEIKPRGSGGGAPSAHGYVNMRPPSWKSISPLNSEKCSFSSLFGHIYDGFCLLKLDVSKIWLVKEKNGHFTAGKPLFLAFIPVTYFSPWTELDLDLAVLAKLRLKILFKQFKITPTISKQLHLAMVLTIEAWRSCFETFFFRSIFRGTSVGTSL